VRHATLLCCLALLVACEKPREQPAADTSMAAGPEPAPAPAAAPISLADLAGTWAMRVMPEGSDSTILTYELTASADGSSWTFNFPNRKPVPASVRAEGDSVLVEAGPYESALRKGVQVTTKSVFRVQDGKLEGKVVAHYASGPDTVVTLHSVGTRK
jgi:glucose/arabinose dehydrogenase